MPIFSFQEKTPRIHNEAVISPLATIIGDVEICRRASVFPGAVIRGDVAKITIGKYSNIQDNAVIHGGDIYEEDTLKGHFPVDIGEYVSVTHGAVVHGSEIGDVSMVGIRAIIFEGSQVGRGSIIGMNATILEKTNIPERSIVVGTPGKVIKNVDDITFSRLKKHALWYYKLAKSHNREILTQNI